MPLSIFGFQALWSPYLLVFCIAIILLYLYIVFKKYSAFENGEKATRKQVIQFSIAMVIFYAIKGSPLDLLGHILFFVHMIQMALLLFLVSPLVIMGIPGWLWERVLKVKVIRFLFNLFANPLVALILFSALFSIYHIPLLFDTVKQNEILHIIMTANLFFASLFLWWPLFNNVPGEPQISGLKQVGYIIGSAILITPACALIIFNDNAMYETYSSGAAWLKAMELCVPDGKLASLGISGPELFTNMPVVEDQQLGGIVMKVVQEIIYGVFLAMVFFKWFRSEQENADAITDKALRDRQALQSNSI
ncbi:cytochrome c oxidase assembly factor CtaG [Paenisporosarcina cavernae]|uniref:Cytochrome c oxidase assembly factor CtaG n=1 Tax=Paenisporosarcina cavernae TaxID=2320858 RepID=A0A385YRW9_9BACL|nr:cytochrome c oxidase assembly factor CtaG [Paenisporosarcina cavernae]AYC29130.1 cytochrome c oxidase assembly factor CtaG [Paenisporosarcina cavernae]